MAARRKLNYRNSNLLPRKTLRLAQLLAAMVIAAVILYQRLPGSPEKSQPRQTTAITQADQDKYHQKSFRVLRAIDGDTIDLDVPDAGEPHTRIRLWGVDTPETKDPRREVMYFGPEAAEFTRQAVEGKTVTIGLEPHEKSRDKYGRLLAYIYLPDGKMLNELLLEQGYAYADPRFKHVFKREFAQLEKQARRDKRGLWLNDTPDQWPHWRKNKPQTSE